VEANNRDWDAAPEFDNSERDHIKEGDKIYAVTMIEGSSPCDGGNQSPKMKTNGILMPLCLPESRRIDFDLHSYLSRAHQSPNAAANHTGIEQIVTQSALGL
jgi:hypothetical protein